MVLHGINDFWCMLFNCSHHVRVSASETNEGGVFSVYRYGKLSVFFFKYCTKKYKEINFPCRH